MMQVDRNRHAQGLFDRIASQYDLLAELLSFRQYGKWRRHLVSHLQVAPEDMVMDLCTGTAGVAVQVTNTYGSRVVGVDLSTEMLMRAMVKVKYKRLDNRISLVAGRAESLAFRDATFDAVCVTYLLRYVEDPEATLREVVRVLKPGGRLVSLDFGVPENVVARALWYAYTRGVLPLCSAAVSRGWREVGAFLGPSISRFDRGYPVERVRRMWLDSGISDVHVSRLSLGGGVVIWGTKEGQPSISP